MRQTSISAFHAEPLAATPHLRAVIAETPSRSVLYVESTRSAPRLEPWSLRSVILLLSLWAAIFLAASATPSLLDDADAHDSEAVFAEMPRPVRLVYRRFLKPRYDAQRRWQLPTP